MLPFPHRGCEVVGSSESGKGGEAQFKVFAGWNVISEAQETEENAAFLSGL